MWQLCHVGMRVPCVNTTIPMTVHETLSAAGLIPDPLGPFQDDDLRWIAESDWKLTRNFDVNAHSHLRVSGVLGPSRIYVAESIVGETDNAFLEYSFPLGSVEGSTLVEIHLLSSVNKASVFSGEIPECPPSEWHGFCGPQYLRIPQYLFGWDWGIGCGSLGVGELNLLSEKPRVLPRVMVSTVVREQGNWFLKISHEAELSLQISLSDLNGVLILHPQTCSETVCEFTVRPVSLWWPKGYGAQTLYIVGLCIEDVCEEREIGFRSVEIRPIGDAWELVWNGQTAITIKGVNLVPSSAFRDSSEEEIDNVFISLKDLGLNLIRQWGGGYYVSD